MNQKLEQALKDLRKDAKHHLDEHTKYLNDRLDIIENEIEKIEKDDEFASHIRSYNSVIRFINESNYHKKNATFNVIKEHFVSIGGVKGKPNKENEYVIVLKNLNDNDVELLKEVLEND